ncbi:glycosyltransferase [Dyadobacter sp. CY323]|uniref:glycosyltransferase n=1 Tax=Dyadobacter sp. CY323 TaxID=2907302 RepID=UPI001F442290|nr:glycosyltransferase [Dyadobacter sp. CY323]MCE6992752.1 glycosyltransferase [Dyadobacter sp. CY323]
MSKRVYLYPMRNLKDLEEKSPYMHNLSKGLVTNFDVVNYGIPTRNGMLDVFKFFTKADVLYFNWIENITWHQLPLLAALVVISKIAGKKVIWTHHNVHPHKGDTWAGKLVVRVMKNWSSVIVFHTRESYNILSLTQEDKRILDYFHPFFENTFNGSALEIKYDVLIWGNVRESKGVREFLDYLQIKKKTEHFNVKLIGKFSNDQFYYKLKEQYAAYPNINIENEFVENGKLKTLHKQSRYVLFIYSGSSVLNSGALIKSIPWGTTVIGPNNAAFKELGERGVILTYNSFDDIIKILEDKEFNKIDKEAVAEMVRQYSWDDLGKKLSTLLSKS